MMRYTSCLALHGVTQAKECIGIGIHSASFIGYLLVTKIMDINSNEFIP